MNILLVDDHAMIRHGVRDALRQAYPQANFGEAASAGEAMQQVHKDRWDIAILDIGLPGRDGVETLKDLKHACPQMPVLMLSMYPEEQFAVRVLKAGAAGYMTKEAAPHELVSAVGKVLGGGKYISVTLAEKLADAINSSNEKALHDRLSDREYQVMCLLASGKTVTEIATMLSLSVKTISTYRAHILEKMNLKTTSEIIRYALKHDLVV